MKDQFVRITNDILKGELKDLSAMSQNNLGQIISPFKQDLNNLKNTIQELYVSEGKERFSLKEEIKNIVKEMEDQ